MVESRAAMKLRASISLSVVVAFFAALTLASSPQLHERLHKVDSQHECAATLVASGKCDHSAPPASAPRNCNIPISPALTPREFAPVNSDIRSSILEHAPPSAI
jgi:hypothetical protein